MPGLALSFRTDASSELGNDTGEKNSNKEDQLRSKKRCQKKGTERPLKKVKIDKNPFLLSCDTGKEIKMHNALVGPLRVLPCHSNNLNIIDLLSLDLLKMFSNVDFEIILWV